MDFCSNRKSIDDFLLVSNRDLSSMSYRFRDIAPRSCKSPHPERSPQIEETPFEFRCQAYQA